MKKVLLSGCSLLALATQASATTQNYQYKDNLGNAYNIQMFQCIGTPVYCTAMVFENSSGVEIMTSSNPGYVQFAAPQAITLSTSPSIAAGSAVVPTQGGAVLSATNGWYGNLLQGNAVLSGTNGLYANILQGNTTLSTGNPLPVTVTNVSSAGQQAMAASSPVAIASDQSAIPVNPFIARTAEPTAATTGTQIAPTVGVEGKTIVLPYAVKETMLRASATTTTTAATTLSSAAGGSVKNYITGVQCFRDDAGTTAITVTFSDTVSTKIVLPNSGGGGGAAPTFAVPLVTAANTGFTFTPGSPVSHVTCNSQGYTGL